MYIEFNRENIVENSLEEFCSCMERSKYNEFIIQYAVIAIHNALQGTMTVFLRSSGITNTWKKQHAKNWEEIEWPKQLATQGLYQGDKFPQLDFFMELYKKCFSNYSDIIDINLIGNLNEQRNIFIHFNTDYQIIEKQYIIDSCNEAIKAIAFILDTESKIFENNKKNIYSLLAKSKI